MDVILYVEPEGDTGQFRFRIVRKSPPKLLAMPPALATPQAALEAAEKYCKEHQYNVVERSTPK